MSIMLCVSRLVWRNSDSEIFLKLFIRYSYKEHLPSQQEI